MGFRIVKNLTQNVHMIKFYVIIKLYNKRALKYEKEVIDMKEKMFSQIINDL